MKRKVALFVSILCALSMTGCSFSSFGETKAKAEEVTVPSDALIISDSNKISLDVGDIKIPDGYTIGSGDFTDSSSGNAFSLVGVWKTVEEEAATSASSDELLVEETPDYKSAVDNDIMFCCMYGEDTSSPDKELDRGEVKSSLSVYSNYLTTFLSLNYMMMDDLTLNDSEGTPIVDDSGKTSTRISKDGNWYYTTFTCTSGEKLTTTYNTLCYPKSYYGLIMLGTNQNPDYSRKYFIFMFSNDSEGNIMEEAEYNSLFTQIKSLYDLHGFYTPVLLSSEKDSSKNYYNGRTYAQFNDLMLDTYNYYILKETNGAAEDVELESETND